MLYHLKEWQKINSVVDAIVRSYAGELESMIIASKYIRFVVWDKYRQRYELIHYDIKKKIQYHICNEKDLRVIKIKMSKVYQYPYRVDTKIIIK